MNQVDVHSMGDSYKDISRDLSNIDGTHSLDPDIVREWMLGMYHTVMSAVSPPEYINQLIRNHAEEEK